ncbi:RDD family protein [Ferribacterium limneticum]|uniref:RDD family protein n=1 Tax=Ferribacterium limneticum TaxID=76259 RepID=UPI001CFBABA6|nr:RDD family protein [Ferribacterium limneticum]
MMTTQLPGIQRRLVCMLYEGLVVFSILLIGFLMPQVVLSGFGWTISPRALWLHILVLLLIYFVWCWLNGGQTLPMKTWKLRIVNANGLPLRPMQAVLRYLIAWPSILLFGIGIFWVMFDKDQQFLHDRLAGTRIVVAG